MGLAEKIDKGQVEDILALTPPQEGLLFHYLNDPRSYCEQLSFRLKGFGKGDRIKQAWRTVAQANQALRMVFRWEGIEAPLQIILKTVELPFSEHDLTSESSNRQQALLESLRADQRGRGLDIQRHPFLVMLCLLPGDEIEMTLTYHHIILDGWSTGVLLKEFVSVCEDLQEDVESVIAPKTSYKAFVRWHQGQSREQQKAYWQSILSGYEGNKLISLPRPQFKEARQTEEEAQSSVRMRVDAAVHAAIQSTARRLQVTPAVVLYTAWAMVLQRYGNTDDVVFGTIVSGRKAELSGIDRMVGLFSGTVPLRVRFEAKERIRDLLLRLDASLKDREPYEAASLAEIQRTCGTQPGKPLFDTIVVIENYPLDQKMITQNAIHLTAAYKRMTYPVTLMVYPFDGLELEIQFASSEFEPSDAQVLLNRYVSMLAGITSGEDHCAEELDLLSEQELCQLENWQGSVTDGCRAERTIYGEFERHAKRLPDKIAAVCGDRSLTYAELNDRANRLASTLRGKGVIPNRLVAVMLDRSLEMIVALLAVMKAGGAYVPIDPAYPEERIMYLLEDSRASLLLTDGRRVRAFAGEVLDLTDESLYEDRESPSEAASGPRDLAYVIYTSGSTGLPKGVMIEHRSVVNRIEWMQQRYSLTGEDVVLQKTSFSFDVSVWELFWWGMSGASAVFLESGGEKNPSAIVQAVNQYGVTVMHFVPSMLQLFLEYVEDNAENKPLRSLQRVFASGEALRVQQASRLKRIIPWVQLVNLYGPTEATVDVSYHECSGDDSLTSIPIGRPIANTSLYVMDLHMRQQPTGLPGELYIGGIGVARGYWGRPDLTAEKFVPYPAKPHERIYKTGDLARRLPNGEIEYLGRIDHQVKIRGYRIEPGEIEHALAKHPAVRHAWVIAKKISDEQCLCVYLQLAGGDDTLPDIKAHAASLLPSYMLPAFYIVLDELPLTANQKIDVSRLPDPAVCRMDSKHTPAQSELEIKLVKIWREVLKTERIGITDHFFELGGNSILLMRLHAKCVKEISAKLSIADLFTYPTIRQLSAFLASDSGTGQTRKLGGFTFASGLTGQGRVTLQHGGFEAFVEGELLASLTKIASLEKTSLDVVLLAMLLYQISDLAGTTDVAIDALIFEDNRVVPAQFAMEKFDSFSALFRAVNLLALSDRRFPFEHWQGWEREPDVVHLLIGRRELLAKPLEPLDVYDALFLMAGGEATGVRLTIDFNMTYLKEDQIGTLLNVYLESLRLLVGHYHAHHIS